MDEQIVKRWDWWKENKEETANAVDVNEKSSADENIVELPEEETDKE